MRRLLHSYWKYCYMDYSNVAYHCYRFLLLLRLLIEYGPIIQWTEKGRLSFRFSYWIQAIFDGLKLNTL